MFFMSVAQVQPFSVDVAGLKVLHEVMLFVGPGWRGAWVGGRAVLGLGWSVERGVRSVECGVWCVECGVWRVERGVWRMEQNVEGKQWFD